MEKTRKRHAAAADRAKFLSSAAQTVSVAGRRRARLKGNPELLHYRASGDGGGGSGGSEFSGNFGAVAAPRSDRVPGNTILP